MPKLKRNSKKGGVTMFKFLILACTFGLGFYVGVMNAENPLVVNGPRVIGVLMKHAAEQTEVAQDLSKDGLQIVDNMGDKAIDSGTKVIKTAPKIFK